MKTQSVTVAPEYCGFYVAGSRDVDVPVDSTRGGIHATAQCLNIPCLYGEDGDTTITLGSYADVAHGSEPAYDGLLETPTKSVLLFDVNMPRIMDAKVESLQTRIRVWMNHPTSPDEVTITLG